MDKLVRDGVPEFLKEQGTHITFRKAKKRERIDLLFTKLLEEAGEWLTARDEDQRLKELGDLQEVIWALAKIDGITPEAILLQAHKKQTLRGNFDELQVMGVELGPDPNKTAPPARPNYGAQSDVVRNNSYAYSG